MFGDKRRPTATIAAEIDRIIGLNIRRAREDVRLGQHEVATLLGISVHLMARYEEGQERAPAATLLELTRHIGCQLTDLFAGMPTLDADDEFQGSQPIGPSMNTPPRPDDVGPDRHRPSDTAEASTGRHTAPLMGDAAVAATVVQAFSTLRSPVVRERLLGLLQALG